MGGGDSVYGGSAVTKTAVTMATAVVTMVVVMVVAVATATVMMAVAAAGMKSQQSTSNRSVRGGRWT